MVYSFGQFQLDEDKRELRRRGAPLPLQPLVFDLLTLLVKNRERVVDKDELQGALWPEGYVSEGSLQRAISLARSAIDDEKHTLIRTYQGRGYRFCADVGDASQQQYPVPGSKRRDERERFAEPRIQYVKTSDGVSIAYSVSGTGLPVVHLGWFPVSHLQAERQFPEIRNWQEYLSEKRMLIRFDARGMGLSERGVTDFSVAKRLLDLEAVVDRLGLEKFVLYAALHNGPLAIAYAAQHPERVSHLLLWCTFAKGNDWLRSERVRAVRSLMDLDWHTYTETAAHAFAAEWERGELAHRVAATFRESVTQEDYVRFVTFLNASDSTGLLEQVKSPTLVLHRREALLAVEVARGLAAGIPDAHLALLEGNGIFEFIGDTESAKAAIDEFLPA
jgi:DNA-binding winged helix-turn-helix (wHTH) protein/pimeloyl-ACP methyl ester carboxylesterase